jgi:hypothetical protein
MNPTLRGFLIIGVIVVGIATIAPLALTFAIVWRLAQIGFYIAIAFFLYMLWRERWSDIETWSRRSKWVFHGAAVLILVEIAIVVPPISLVPAGIPLLAWALGIAICAYSMWRVFKDEHTYS